MDGPTKWNDHDCGGVTDGDERDSFVSGRGLSAFSVLYCRVCYIIVVLIQLSKEQMESDKDRVYGAFYGSGDTAGMLCESCPCEIIYRCIMKELPKSL